MSEQDRMSVPGPMLHPINLKLELFTNSPIACQVIKLLAHIETALAVSAAENRQVDLNVHVNNKSKSDFGLLVGMDRVPPHHGSTEHYIGDGVGI